MQYSWTEALISCMEMDMTLVSIESYTKSNEINSLVRSKFGNVKLWIGGIMSRYPSRHFIWLNTGKRFSYTNWHGNNPDFFANNEYCAHIGWGRNLEWNDLACTDKLGYICEPNQKKLETKQLQQQVEKENKKLQDLQQQLQLEIQKQNELQQQVQNEQEQKIKLQQELDKIKASSEEEKITLLNLKKQFEEYQQKLKEQIQQNEKLEEDLKGVYSREHNLEQDLLLQKNLKDLAEEELQKLKTTSEAVKSETHKKYRDIILHFHQN